MREISGCSGIKGANQLIQLENREIILDYLGEPNAVIRVLIRERLEGQRRYVAETEVTVIPSRTEACR